MHIRKDDQVEVITGDDKGSSVRPDDCQGAPRPPREEQDRGRGRSTGVYKHLKPSAKNQQGGRLSKEMPINASNVMLYCPSCTRGVRVGHRFTDEGRKQRYCKACSAALGDVGPAKAARLGQEGLIGPYLGSEDIPPPFVYPQQVRSVGRLTPRLVATEEG